MLMENYAEREKGGTSSVMQMKVAAARQKKLDFFSKCYLQLKILTWNGKNYRLFQPEIKPIETQLLLSARL